VLHAHRVIEDRQSAPAADQTRQNAAFSRSAVVAAGMDSGLVTAPDTQPEKIVVSNDNVDREEVEYSASVKVNSSFVADSLAVDVCHSEKSDVNALNQPGHAEPVQVKSETGVEMDCESEISVRQLPLQHSSQHLRQRVDTANGVVPHPTQQLANGSMRHLSQLPVVTTNTSVQQPLQRRVDANRVMHALQMSEHNCVASVMHDSNMVSIPQEVFIFYLYN